MASMKLAAAALAVVLLVCAAATTATAYRPAPEDCKTQARYFQNCLRLGMGEACCRKGFVVADTKCFCEVEREADLQCAPGRKCGGIAGIVKVAEMHLTCLENLKCKKRA
ncbi:hypothetical protein ACUV84_024905 [Puccinellia chinampoensis]